MTVVFVLFLKNAMQELIDNENDDEHFYEVFVITGQRNDEGTRSKVREMCFSMSMPKMIESIIRVDLFCFIC